MPVAEIHGWQRAIALCNGMYNLNSRPSLTRAVAGATHVGEWLSLVEHLVRDQGVGGSNPLSPTNYLKVQPGDMGYRMYRSHG